MQENRQRYQDELRRPFVTLLEQIATRHLRELDPQLDTTVKTNRVLAGIRKRFPDDEGEYHPYLWGAFSRGRKQEDVQLAVLVQGAGLEASLFLGSATPEQTTGLAQALTDHGDALFAPLTPYLPQLRWQAEDRGNPLAARTTVEIRDAKSARDWLANGGNSIKWDIAHDDPVLYDPALPDRIGELFRTLHPWAAAAWGDLTPDTADIEPVDTAEEVAEIEGRLTVEQVAAACHLPMEQVEKWVAALHGTMRQAIFYGPPGTGKTYVAQQLARHLASSPEHIETVQFHPSYSYEDFIEGLRPDSVASGGTLTYTVRPGIFREFCNRARRASSDTFVLIVDEMNRADLASVFGELLLLLEYRGDTTLRLPYSQQQFSVPRNLIVLGTMNTADRSLALVDFALRRRFNAFPLMPSAEVLRHWAQQRPLVDVELLIAVFTLIGQRVGLDNHVSPGHSYWMVEDSDVPGLRGRGGSVSRGRALTSTTNCRTTSGNDGGQKPDPTERICLRGNGWTRYG